MSPKLIAVNPVLSSRDVTASIRFYKRLGFDAVFLDSVADPKYAALTRDGLEIHLQWHDPDEWKYPNDKPTYRFVVDDVDGLHEKFKESGVENMTPLGDTAWGTREFHVQDPDFNGLQFYRDL